MKHLHLHWGKPKRSFEIHGQYFDAKIMKMYGVSYKMRMFFGIMRFKRLTIHK